MRDFSVFKIYYQRFLYQERDPWPFWALKVGFYLYKFVFIHVFVFVCMYVCLYVFVISHACIQVYVEILILGKGPLGFWGFKGAFPHLYSVCICNFIHMYINIC
jgi:hypothetical protein